MSTTAELVPTAAAPGFAMHTAAGTTAAGKGWNYDSSNKGLWIDVDTSSGGFTTTPVYVASISGTERHWRTTGGCAVYLATKSSFRIYLRYPDGPIEVKDAQIGHWQVNWIAVGK